MEEMNEKVALTDEEIDVVSGGAGGGDLPSCKEGGPHHGYARRKVKIDGDVYAEYQCYNCSRRWYKLNGEKISREQFEVVYRD